MAFQGWSIVISVLSRWIAGLSIGAFLLLIMGSLPRELQARGAHPTAAQETKRVGDAAKNGVNTAVIARGKYIVDGVAACADCHTPRKQNHELDYDRWLAGAAVPYLSARPEPNWPIVAQRLAGIPPANDSQMITLLTTGIWVTGKPLRWPMPRFHMTRADAETVLAYLKSVTRSPDATP